MIRTMNARPVFMALIVAVPFVAYLVLKPEGETAEPPPPPPAPPESLLVIVEPDTVIQNFQDEDFEPIDIEVVLAMWEPSDVKPAPQEAQTPVSTVPTLYPFRQSAVVQWERKGQEILAGKSAFPVISNSSEIDLREYLDRMVRMGGRIFVADVSRGRRAKPVAELSARTFRPVGRRSGGRFEAVMEGLDRLALNRPRKLHGSLLQPGVEETAHLLAIPSAKLRPALLMPTQFEAVFLGRIEEALRDQGLQAGYLRELQGKFILDDAGFRLEFRSAKPWSGRRRQFAASIILDSA